MSIELGYFCIPTEDVARGRSFYGTLFGWQFADDATDVYAHITSTQVPGGLASGMEASLPQVWFRVQDIGAAVTRVRELGGHAEDPKQSPSGWGSACRDDQGTQFNLWQPAPGY
jgi:uncharacterized protein